MRYGWMLAGLLALGAANGCGDDDPSAPADASPPVDAAMDAGLPDAGPPDAGPPDAGEPDAGPAFTGPELLSDTGLYADIASRTLAEGIVEYEVRHELWSDGADKRRFLLLPDGEAIDTRDVDRWRFPVGTRAWKEFHRDGVHVETRLLMKEADGWQRVAYVWLEDGSDAVATPEGLENALGTEHDVPDTDTCFRCHRGAVDDLIGVSALQLTDPEGPDLLETLVADGRLTDPPATEPDVPGTGVVQDALGYMHANCGHCHNDDYPLATLRDLRLWMPVGTATPEDSPAYRTAIGSTASHTIGGTNVNVFVGEPYDSQLYVRMLRRDDNAMPPEGTELVDPTGSETIRQWIESLAP